jgi:hypothetical protein
VISSKQLEDDRLFKKIIEQLKLPLLHIARQTELAKYGTLANYDDLNSIAEMSIKMIDSYLLTAGQNNQLSLDFEPVSISSALHAAADNLTNLAKLYNCSVELHIAGKYGPVMSQKNKLVAAYTMLGYSFIEANLSNNTKNKRGRVILTGYRTSQGLVAGVFSPEISISNESFHRAINTYDTKRQAIPEVSQSTGAGILIANSIFNDLATRLRVAHYKRISGLAATLIPSHQLQLM